MKIPTNIRSIAKLSLSSFQNNFALYNNNKSVFRFFSSNAERKLGHSNAQSNRFFSDESKIDIENNINPQDKYKNIFDATYVGGTFAYILASPHMAIYHSFAGLLLFFILSRSIENRIYDTEFSIDSLYAIRGLSGKKDIAQNGQSNNFEEELNKTFRDFPLFFRIKRPISKLWKKGIDPKLMELSLLKSKIDSYNLHTVKTLLSKGITTELEGEVGSFEYASMLYPQDSKMVELLKTHCARMKPIKSEKQQTDHAHDKKPLLSIYPKKDVPSRG